MQGISDDKKLGANLLVEIGQACVRARHDVERKNRFHLGSPEFFNECLGSLQETSSQSASNHGELDGLSFDPNLSPEDFFASSLRTYEHFEDSSVRAMLDVIRFRASMAHDSQVFFHYWLSENLRAWLGQHGWNQAAHEEIKCALRSRVQDMITMGINLRGRHPRDFLAAIFDYQSRRLPGYSEANWTFDTILSTVSFVGAGVLEAIEVLSLLPHLSEKTCSVFGQLAGIFYGEDRLLALTTYGSPLADFLPQGFLEGEAG